MIGKIRLLTRLFKHVLEPRTRASSGQAYCSRRRRLGAVLILALLASISFGCPELQGPNGAVRDNLTDRVLYSQNDAGYQAVPYSTVKVMTLHLALRALHQGKIDLTTPLTMSQHAVNQDCNCFPNGDKVLVAGDVMPVRTALYSIGLSHGETTMAMAELVANVNRKQPVVSSGTSLTESQMLEQEFIVLMNEEAKLLGLDHTFYTSVHGAPSPSQRTSVNDLAKLWDAAVTENPDFTTYTGTRNFPYLMWFPLANEPFGAIVPWPTRMFNYYPGIDGDKDGCCSGDPNWRDRALVTQATRAGRSLTASVLMEKNWTTATQDNAELLRWGFENIFTPSSWAEGNHIGSISLNHTMDCHAWSDVITASESSSGDLELIRWSARAESMDISKIATYLESGGGDGDVVWVNANRIVAVYTVQAIGVPSLIRATLYGTDDGIYPIDSVDFGPGQSAQVERLNDRRVAVAFASDDFDLEVRSLAVTSEDLMLEGVFSQYVEAETVKLAQGTSPIYGSPVGDAHVVAVVGTPNDQLTARGFQIDEETGFISDRGVVTLGSGGAASVVRSGPLGHYAVSMRRLNGELTVHFLDGNTSTLTWFDQVQHQANPVERTAIAGLGQKEFSVVVAERNAAGKLALGVWDLDEANEAPGDFERLAHLQAGPGPIADAKICELSVGGSQGHYVTSVRSTTGGLRLQAWSVGKFD